MTEVVVVCEGRTEEIFTQKVLSPALACSQVYVQARLIATSKHSKGGALSRDRVVRYLRKTLMERREIYVTTFFDLYGLPSNFPGQSEAMKGDPIERAKVIEKRLHEEVIQESKCHPGRFFPHIQPYEFESLLFSDTSKFMEEEPSWRKFSVVLAKARQKVESPEHVNDGDNTHPSARLKKLMSPSYRKVQHGSAISKCIGLDCMRSECCHFDDWVTRLECISSQNR